MSKLGVEEFLDHKGSAGGGKYIDWKKNKQTQFWLHPGSHIHGIWNHPWAVTAKAKDKNTEEEILRVFGRKFNCHEPEFVLQKRNFRDRKTGERELPPKVCPMCLMLEHVRGMVRRGEISWVDEVFRFEGDNPDETRSMTAAGLYGGFSLRQGESHTKEQKADLRKARIKLEEVYEQNASVKLQYLFVGMASVNDGLQVAFETQALGDKMKDAIRKTVKQAIAIGKGREMGDPMKNPYPFLWEYDETADFSKRYDVTALGHELYTPEVAEVLKREPPDLTKQLEPGDCIWLRESLEKHCVLPNGLPWDQIFKPAFDAGLMVPKAKDENHDADGLPAIGGDAADDESIEVQGASAEDEVFECDACKAPTLTNTSTECSACGATYDPETNDLLTRKCVHEGCDHQVELDRKPESQGRSICSSCGTVYTNEDWSVFKAAPKIEAKPEAKPEPPKVRTRSQMKAEAAAKVAEKPAGDRIPFK